MQKFLVRSLFLVLLLSAAESWALSECKKPSVVKRLLRGRSYSLPQQYVPETGIFGTNKPFRSESEFRSYYHNCYGTLTFPDGHKYVGEWKNGQPHGHGVFTSADGGGYNGEWKEEKYHGQGTLTLVNGDQYVGEFRDDKYWGQGTLTYANGDRYHGEFRWDNRDGLGIFTFANGDRYTGEYNNNAYHGQGTLTYADGTEYSGGWWENQYNGQGILSYANGDRYHGEFRKGHRNGRGTLTYADGRVDKGLWEHGQFKGNEEELKYINGMVPPYVTYVIWDEYHKSGIVDKSEIKSLQNDIKTLRECFKNIFSTQPADEKMKELESKAYTKAQQEAGDLLPYLQAAGVGTKTDWDYAQRAHFKKSANDMRQMSITSKIGMCHMIEQKEKGPAKLDF